MNTNNFTICKLCKGFGGTTLCIGCGHNSKFVFGQHGYFIKGNDCMQSITVVDTGKIVKLLEEIIEETHRYDTQKDMIENKATTIKQMLKEKDKP
jgi:hypothetical protein